AIRTQEIAPSLAGQIPIGGKSTLSSEQTQVLAPAFECTTHTAPNDVSPLVPRFGFGISPPELSNGLKRGSHVLRGAETQLVIDLRTAKAGPAHAASGGRRGDRDEAPRGHHAARRRGARHSVVSKTARPVRGARLNLGPNAGALSSLRDRKSSAQNPTYGDARGSGVILTKRSWQRLTNSGSRTRVKRSETLEKS